MAQDEIWKNGDGFRVVELRAARDHVHRTPDE